MSDTTYAPGFYPLHPVREGGQARVGYLSHGSMPGVVMVFRSLAGYLRGTAYVTLVGVDQISGPALALESDSRHQDGDRTVTTRILVAEGTDPLWPNGSVLEERVIETTRKDHALVVRTLAHRRATPA